MKGAFIMGKVSATEAAVRKTIVEMANYLQLQRNIEQQLDIMLAEDAKEDKEMEELWERTRIEINLNTALTRIKEQVAEKEKKLEELFEKIFFEEKLGIQVFGATEAYENARWLWQQGEIIEDLYEDILNTSPERLKSATLILQSLAGYKPWDLDGPEEKDKRVSFLIGPKTWEDDVQRKAEWYKQRAQNGDANAQYMLGHMHYYGFGVEQNYVEATKQWRRAGKQGHAAAKCYLGKCYAQENDSIKGVIPDCEKALKLWNESARLGNQKAQYFLEKYYYRLPDEEKDYAWRWDEEGMANMAYEFGTWYENGWNGEPNMNLALKEYRRAVFAGSQKAIDRIMRGSMCTEPQMEELE